MKAPTPRAYTAEEVQRMFILHLLELAKYWSEVKPDSPLNNTELGRMEGLVHSILVAFDGVGAALPSMDIALRPHPSDREFLKSQGENWFAPGMVFNTTMLHEIMYRVKEGKSI